MNWTIPKTMCAAVYRGADDLRLETVPVPRIGPDELLVRIAVCGVCPTDIKKIQYGTVPPPRIFGHEMAGTIARVGARVRQFKVGERVALHHHVPCLECHACRHHAYAQCAQYKRTGVTAGFEPAGGGFAQYVRVMPFVLPGVVRIPRRNSFEQAAMLEPVNTVLKAVKRLSLLPGDSILVAGQGPIGLMFTRLLQLQRMNVVATDLLAPRLQLAREFGARWTFQPNLESPAPAAQNEPPTRVKAAESNLRRGASGNRLRAGARASTVAQRSPRSRALDADAVTRITGGRGFDAAVLAVPSDAALREALSWMRGAGQIMLFAHTRRGALTGLDLASVCVDEKDLLGSYSADFSLQREVAQIVFSGRLDVGRLITNRFALADAAAAVRLATHPAPDSLKVILVNDPAVQV